MRVWSKRISARLEEDWRARLAWLPDERVVTSLNPATPATLRLQVFDVSEEEARALESAHGGKTAEIRQDHWFNADQGARKPLRVKDRLLVANNEESWRRAHQEFPDRPAILIPPEMAFGTGEHATTITALRRLVEVAARLEKSARPWSCCDAGTGSGLLAIAAEILGAARIDAFDFDEVAVEIARRNAAANECPRTRFFTQDVLAWTPPAEGYDIVLANIYGEVLIQAMPTLFRAVRPGGTLILSGILRSQAENVWASAVQNGLTQASQHRLGKWVTGVWGRPE
jgi:ribosomal protein L11 methyltransferase